MILLVIVLYNQRLGDCNTYKTLISKYRDINVYIFDNSPQPQHTIEDFEGLSYHYVSDTSNPGLSYAYNAAAHFARINNFQWILLLDQDTSFPNGIIDKYKDAVTHNPDVKLFAPNVLKNKGKYMSPVKHQWYIMGKSIIVNNMKLSTKKYSAINSGLLINIDAFFNIGGYNERVWLDYSDFDFIDRFSAKYKYFYVIDSICHQSFSNDIQTHKEKLERFKIFCNCIKAIDKPSLNSKIKYSLIVIKRAISISVRSNNYTAIHIMLNKYFR